MSTIVTQCYKVQTKCLYLKMLNIQGICGKEMVKFSEINLMLSSQENKKLHAFAMCETKLKDHKMSGAFKIKGFQTHFCKDNSSNGGVYIKNGDMAKRRQDLEDDNIECLWGEITPTKGKPFDQKAWNGSAEPRNSVLHIF